MTTKRDRPIENQPDEPEVARVDYRRINPKCYVCDGSSTVVRITAATDGELYVSTLCEQHAVGEQKYLAEKHGMECIPGTGTFVNVELYESLAPAMDALLEGVVERSAK